MIHNDFQNLLQKFFLERLMNQQKVSACTINSYKDTFRLFFRYMKDECNTQPDLINMEMVNADRVISFLNYLENIRKNKQKTINNRLAAIKSFMDYVSYECPEYLGIIRKVKAIPFRNITKNTINYLTNDEVNALLGACETKTTDGRRTYMILLLLYNSGMRVSEMISLKRSDISFLNNDRCHLRILGKGRKERVIPLWKTTKKCLVDYVSENNINENDYLLVGRNVEHLTRSGVRYKIDKVAKKAANTCPSLENKVITPHVFRHSTAMSLLQSGIDISTIAIWLGHESIETTHQYMVADIKLKEAALEKLHEPQSDESVDRYYPDSSILQFLNTL